MERSITRINKVTIKDIAKKADVSYATVSRALADSSLISSETKNRILKICNEMGYTKNYVAQSMVLQKSDILGLMLPTIDNPFMSELAHYVEMQARVRGYNIMLCNSAEDIELEQKMFNLLLGHQVDGVIVFPVNQESSARLEKYAMQHVPIMFVNDYKENIRCNIITTDNFKGAYIGTEYLLSLGHTNTMFFSDKPMRASHIKRLEGYTSACRDHNIVPNFYYDVFGSDNKVEFIPDIDDMEKGYRLGVNFIENQGYLDYSAVFAPTDLIALGFLKAADILGLKVPEDISVLGFDDIKYSSLPKIELTTIKQPLQLIASIGVDNLVDLIESGTESYSHRFLEPQLIIRKTCMKRGN